MGIEKLYFRLKEVQNILNSPGVMLFKRLWETRDVAILSFITLTETRKKNQNSNFPNLTYTH